MPTRRKPVDRPRAASSPLADALRDSVERLLEAGLDAVARAGPDPGRILDSLLGEAPRASRKAGSASATTPERLDGPSRQAFEALVRRVEALEEAAREPPAARTGRTSPAAAKTGRASPSAAKTARARPSPSKTASARPPPSKTTAPKTNAAVPARGTSTRRQTAAATARRKP